MWALLPLFIVTVRSSSCEKVMFSQVCVKNSVHGDGIYGEGGMWQRGTCMVKWGHVWWGGMSCMGACVVRGPCMVKQRTYVAGGSCLAGETATTADGIHPIAMHSPLILAIPNCVLNRNCVVYSNKLLKLSKHCSHSSQ